LGVNGVEVTKQAVAEKKKKESGERNNTAVTWNLGNESIKFFDPIYPQPEPFLGVLGRAMVETETSKTRHFAKQHL